MHYPHNQDVQNSYYILSVSTACKGYHLKIKQDNKQHFQTKRPKYVNSLPGEYVTTKILLISSSNVTIVMNPIFSFNPFSSCIVFHAVMF
jgi:hypothetical protein